MEIRQMVQFVAVAELRNFRRAAERLHMAQPPLSQAIRRLERELDVRLFDRTSRAVELTESGKVLLDESRRILSQIESAVLVTQRTAQGRAGRLSVGFSVPWAHEVLPAVLQRFRDAHPGVTLALREVASSEQVRMLLGGDLDFGFLRLPGRYEAKGMETIVLREDALWVVLPKKHPLAAARTLSVTQLQREAFVLPPIQMEHGTEQFSFRMQVTSLCAEAGFSPHVAQEASQMQTIVRLVETGLGISLVPGWTRRHFSSSAAYVALASKSDLARLKLAAAWSQANPSPIVNRFRESVLGVRGRKKASAA